MADGKLQGIFIFMIFSVIAARDARRMQIFGNNEKGIIN